MQIARSQTLAVVKFVAQLPKVLACWCQSASCQLTPTIGYHSKPLGTYISKGPMAVERGTRTNSTRFFLCNYLARSKLQPYGPAQEDFAVQKARMTHQWLNDQAVSQGCLSTTAAAHRIHIS